MINTLFENPNPTCDKECRFTESVRGTTAVYYPPTYDKNGNNINPDRNTTTYQVYCGVCQKRWNAKIEGGKCQYHELETN